jgi:hypothetical protein
MQALHLPSHGFFQGNFHLSCWTSYWFIIFSVWKLSDLHRVF